jgi:Tfp pilus assembly protein PilX
MSPTKKFQKGVSLYLTIVILSVLTAAFLSLVTISVSQIRIIWTLGHSIVAFYAADSGIEEMLKDRESPNPSYSGYLDLNGNGTPDNNEDAFYEVTVTASGSNCSAQNYCVKSVGRYKKTKRAIEIKY